MPYKSKKQRGYLHIHEPELAAKWDKKYGGKVKKGKPSPKSKKKPASPNKQARAKKGKK